MSKSHQKNIDHDRLFKELITTFFWEFIELFFPQIIGYVEKKSLIFFPQEIFTDVTLGERRKLDVVAQVKFRGQKSFFLIHIEAQSYTESVFERRMFHYFARLDEKHGLPVYPIAIFSFDAPQRPEPNSYKVEFPDCKVLEFNYATIQLNRLNWRDFLENKNPVAAALMAKMKIEPKDRPKVKAECLRMLVTLQLDPARQQLISGFVDTYLRLNEAEEETFTEEIEQMKVAEKEEVMEIVTSWMERGIEQGLHQGLQRETDLVMRLINRRLGILEESLASQIRQLPIELTEDLGEALFDFQSQTDLVRWLEQNADL